MEIGQAQVVRNDWYDRSPLPIILGDNGVYAPTADVTRISYTVPANRVFKLTSFMAELSRVSGASPNLDMWIFLSIYNNTPVLIDSFGLIHRTIGLQEPILLTPNINILVPAGYEVRVETGDNSTGGLVNMSCGIGGTEYDA